MHQDCRLVEPKLEPAGHSTISDTGSGQGPRPELMVPLGDGKAVQKPHLGCLRGQVFFPLVTQPMAGSSGQILGRVVGVLCTFGAVSAAEGSVLCLRNCNLLGANEENVTDNQIAMGSLQGECV